MEYSDPGTALDFSASLERWVMLQKKLLETVDQAKDRVGEYDRLELILSIRTLFQNMMRTLKAFDTWLQDPFITSQMPREYLQYVWSETYKSFRTLVELDIKHTSDMAKLIRENISKGTVNPLVTLLRDIILAAQQEKKEKEDTQRGLYTI
ncbi:MAG: DUF2153 domain-containing protein [Desulfurococcales archaeon]|nr:DUF2153 domain-containing protein [Desulfurococcales archaeon]MEB3773019.1 DUF2153 domain-containing protein [Desulfurococcales archaeon]MEB3786977.1 DUF2153 domain-containing protein [Desulfurococcales archaeon]MEB3799508.1 DUF2153 domain-containing protein [Desulfurococcales archaeon]MEB3845797.1 DUF2153 domain-containing protein [Desulfurococcales archaeon]